MQKGDLKDLASLLINDNLVISTFLAHNLSYNTHITDPHNLVELIHIQSSNTMSGSTPATAGPSTTSADVSMDGADTFHDFPEPPLPEGLTTNPEDPDDHDEIAHTIPIYISHNLSPALHLFQYPVHHRPPAVTSYAEQRGQHISARMKENVHRFEIEVPVDMRPTVWNEDRAEELGFLPVEEQDAKKKGKKKDEKPENWGSKMRLKSEEVPNVTGYWAGLVHEGEY